MTYKEVTFIGTVLFFILAVWQFVRFRRRYTRKTLGNLMGVSAVKKIVATGPPKISENVPAFLKPNRRQRRAEKRLKEKKKVKHLDGPALINEIKKDRERIRSGELIETNEFLHILKKQKNNGGKK